MTEKEELDKLLDQALKSYAPDVAPVGLERRVLAAVAAEPVREVPRVRHWWPAPALAFAAALVVTAFLATGLLHEHTRAAPAHARIEPTQKASIAPRTVVEDAVAAPVSPVRAMHGVSQLSPEHQDLEYKASEHEVFVVPEPTAQQILLAKIAAEYSSSMDKKAKASEGQDKPLETPEISIAAINLPEIAVKPLSVEPIIPEEQGNKHMSQTNH